MGKLEYRNGDDGKRFYLDGRGVNCGRLLEMQVGEDRWIRVRFEVEFSPGNPGEDDRCDAVLYATPTWGDGEDDFAIVPLKHERYREFRWPTEREVRGSGLPEGVFELQLVR